MNFTTRDIQVRINSLDILKRFDKPYLSVDGMNGPNTRFALKKAMDFLGVNKPSEIFHPSGLKRIHWHWAASSYLVSDYVRTRYNDVFDDKGNQFDGKWLAEHQAVYSYPTMGASHTRMANTGAIGLSLACMAGASYAGKICKPGKYPPTWDAIDAMLERSADYCEMYDIKVSPWTTLTHAEIQPTLGIAQKWKWDIQVLPDDPSKMLTPKEAGDILRSMLKEKLNER